MSLAFSTSHFSVKLTAHFKHILNLTFPYYYYYAKKMFEFSVSNVTAYLKFLMLLQKEMFTCISDDIKPIGYTFNSASFHLLKH